MALEQRRSRPRSRTGPLTSATNSSAATPATSMPASASPISAGPSNANERPSSGSGATRLAQTSSASASGGCAIARERVAHAPGRRPRRRRARTAGSARSRRGRSRSRRARRTRSRRRRPARAAGARRARRAAIAIVKITCSWSSSEASPTGSPWSMATNSRPNLTTPSAAPIAEHVAPRHLRAPDEEDRRDRHQREAQRVEQQRREVLEPHVDDDEVDAPDAR